MLGLRSGLLQTGSSILLPVAVLDGELAVRCNPQPALAGSNSHSRPGVFRTGLRRAALMVWSRATATREPRQVWKEATVNGARRVPRGYRAGAS
jgi:hypothetical protein